MATCDASIKNMKRNNVRQKRTVSVLCLLSFVVSILVFWQLRIIGITMTDEACCGITEHTHTEECIEKVLICGLEESTAYSCGYEEGEEILLHSHDESCYNEQPMETNSYGEPDSDGGNAEAAGGEISAVEMVCTLLCETPETEIHHHTEECTEVPAHIHTESCYEIIYTCGMEEHTHTLDCYTDPTADVESPAVWEATLPARINDRAVDLVGIARSQLGYRESTRNIIFESLGDGLHAAHGYTRYGAWYGGAQQFAYVDNWSAMFASFCLHYAAIPQETAPQNHGCNTMMQAWQAVGRFEYAASYSPQYGDLVFLRKDGSSSANSVGIISSVNAYGFTAIEGNSHECVEENAYSFSDAAILGYGVFVDEAMAEPEEPAASENTEVVGVTSALTTAGSWIVEGRQRGRMRLLAGGAIPNMELNYYITSITGSGTTLNTDTGYYDTFLHIDFSMLRSAASSSLNTGTGSMRYDLPGEIILSDQLLDNCYNAYKIGDNTMLAFHYWFRVNPNVPEGTEGHYFIEIQYDRGYLEDVNADAQITNYIAFSCSVDGDDDSGKDGIQIEFKGDYDLDIPPEDITEYYDVRTQKSGSLISTDGNRLRYTVIVSTTNGTPGDIAFSDKLTYTESGGSSSVGSPSLVSVTRLPNNDNVTSSCALTPLASDPTAFGMTLPQLAAGESYRVIYEYEINGLPENAEFTANNAVSATTESMIKAYQDTASYTIRRSTQPKLGKSGTLQSDGSIQWKIVINPARTNIAGKLLTDVMFGQLTVGDITVQNSNNQSNPTAAAPQEYTIQYDATTGNVTGIQFLSPEGSTENTNCYTITYSTPTGVMFGESLTVNNTAAFDGESAGANVTVGGGSVSKTVDSYANPSGNLPGSITWRVGVTIPSGGIEAGTVFEDIFGISGSSDSNDHYMTAQQYANLASVLEGMDWWSSMTALTYTTDGENFLTGTPGETDRILGYRFAVAEDSAGNELAGQHLTWSYTTTASMVSSGGASDIPAYDSTKVYYGGDQVTYQGFIYQAKYWTRGDIPTNGGPWMVMGSSGGTADYRSFINTIHVGDKNLTVKKSFSSTVRKYNVVLNDYGSFTLNEAASSFFFNETATDTAFRWIVEADATTTDTYRVIDTLPDGVRLVRLYVASESRMTWELDPWNSQVNFTSDGAPFTAALMGYTVSGSYDADGENVVDLSIIPAATGKFRVLYVCELDEEYLPESGESVTYRLRNAVEVKKVNETIGEADNTIIVTAEERKAVTEKNGTLNYEKNPDGTWKLDGSGNKIWDKTITYTVTVNPNGENLLVNPELDPNDTLHLKDTLSYVYTANGGTGSVTLSLSSIQLEDAQTHEIIHVEWTARTTISGNVKTAVIEGDVPDGRAMLLTYTYSVWSTMTNGISLHNEVTIQGEAFQHSEYDDEHSKEEFDTYAGSDYMEYQLIKVDKDTRRPLSGAQFAVYAWAMDPENSSYTWLPLGKTYTSDENGIIKISPTDRADGTQTSIYTNNTAYCVREVTAPFGYILDEEHSPSYYFWISLNADSPENAPAGFTAQAVDLANSSGQEYVENIREERDDYILPETGCAGALLYVMCGLLLMGLSTALILRHRRRQERRFAS